MEDMIRAIVARPGKPAVAQEIDGSLEGLQSIVQGPIQCLYPYDDQIGIVCNDEAKLVGMPLNRALRSEAGEIYDVIAGNMIIVGLSEDDFQSLSPDQELKYMDMFKNPERFEYIAGKLQAIPISIDTMMSYEAFSLAVADSIKSKLKQDGIDAALAPCAVDKAQLSYHAIRVTPARKNVGMTLNLESAFDYYRRSNSFDAAVDGIYAAVKSGLGQMPDVQVENLRNYDWVKANLSAEVINAETNQEYLKKIPHTDLIDLAVIYRIHLADKADGSATAVVTDQMLRGWGVSVEMLNHDAIKSAEEHYPLQIMSMGAALSGLTGQEFPETDVPLTIATAEGKPAFGAGVMIYPDFAEKAAEAMHGDYYILPSSRHEVILVPDNKDYNLSLASLQDTVNSINASDVIKPEDFLSDSVYHYSVVDKKLELATDFQTRSREMEMGKTVARKQAR